MKSSTQIDSKKSIQRFTFRDYLLESISQRIQLHEEQGALLVHSIEISSHQEIQVTLDLETRLTADWGLFHTTQIFADSLQKMQHVNIWISLYSHAASIYQASSTNLLKPMYNPCKNRRKVNELTIKNVTFLPVKTC